MGKLHFRPCGPQDVDAVLPLIYSSGPAAFDYVFCDSSAQQSLDFLRHAFLRGKSEFGYQQHIAAEIDGTLVGVAALRDASQNLAFTFAAFTDIATFYSPMAALRTLVRGLRTERIIQPPAAGEAIIYHLGVDSEHRGRGIGSELIDRICAMTLSRGLYRLALDVAATNPRARELYWRLGFRERKTRSGKLHSPFGSVCDHTSMEISLLSAQSPA